MFVGGFLQSLRGVGEEQQEARMLEGGSETGTECVRGQEDCGAGLVQHGPGGFQMLSHCSRSEKSGH